MKGNLMNKFKKILKSTKRKLRLFYWELTLGDLLTQEQILQIVDGEEGDSNEDKN